MKYLALILFILMIANVHASCNDGQIDVNTASKEELDSLYGIGPVKAEAIIDSRPFDSVEDLIDVWGIGEVTLQKIKEQGLACVDGNDEEQGDEEVEEEQDEVPNQEDFIINKSSEPEESKQIEEPNTIKLNPQIIKSEDSKENEEDSDKSNYAIYGFVIFCIVLGFLFILRRNKFNKNEFK